MVLPKIRLSYVTDMVTAHVVAEHRLCFVDVTGSRIGSLGLTSFGCLSSKDTEQCCDITKLESGFLRVLKTLRSLLI